MTAISTVVSGIEALPDKPTVRVVFTWNGSTPTPPSNYASAISDLDPHAYVMGELLDSSYEKTVPVSTYTADVKNYLSSLGSTVNIWEIGNEVNGNWTGPYSTDELRLVDAYDDVSAAGRTAALTLFANEYGPTHCGDGPTELTPVQFSEDYVPASVRDGLSYVFESYYPTTCQTIEPSSTEVASEMADLHILYPNAKLGFGELGLPTAATPSTAAKAAQIMAWGYALDPGLSYYVGGYFWWYAYEDCFTGTKLLSTNLVGAFDSESAALGGVSAPTGLSFTSATSATFMAGEAGSFSITTTKTSSVKLTESGTLPSGLSFKTQGDGTATIAGTLAAGTGGVHDITVTAANSSGAKAAQSFSLIVDQAPALTSATTATFNVGSEKAVTLSASGYPAPSITESGTLPKGLSFKTDGGGTASISGTPGSGAQGTYRLTLTASNGVGTRAAQSFTLTVTATTAAPAFTSSATVTFRVGSEESATISASGNPAPTISASGALPKGLSFKTQGGGTATISGIPASGTGGVYALTLVASNSAGRANQALTLVVDQPSAFSSASSATFISKRSNTFAVTSSGYPEAKITVSGTLPTGVRFTTDGNGTATISGTPTTRVKTVYRLVLRATNGTGIAANQTFTLTVEPRVGGAD